MRPGTIKLLEENIGSKLLHTDFDNVLNLTPKAKAIKQKRANGSTQTKKPVHSKGNHQQSENAAY